MQTVTRSCFHGSAVWFSWHWCFNRPIHR